MIKKFSFVFALFIATFSFAQTTWTVDKAHTHVGFSVDHMVVSEVEGKFTDFEGSVVTNGDDLTNATFNFKINVNSVDTGNAKRDGHLKGADFFEAEKYPTMTFKSTKVEKLADNKYRVYGDFSLHGVTKEINLTLTYGGKITDPWGNTRAGLKIKGEIDRTDFGLEYNSVMKTGGLLIGKEVALSVKIELIKNK